ncbi:MAG: sugar transferase [Sporocytophaga sp.]|uniref:sugar transferase n=1 Tax=Sporocytophaga sp. TaxID=2231183 RepID=UPI001B28A59B|nr:sugar transferase [Sporocytophaga sp.]MBO9700784.1 sugar transferase [Sporocytophaga sp.]
MKSKIAFVGTNSDLIQSLTDKLQDEFNIRWFDNSISLLYAISEENEGFEAIVTEGPFESPKGTNLFQRLRGHKASRNIPFILIADNIDIKTKKQIHQQGVNELFSTNFDKENFVKRVRYLITNPVEISESIEQQQPNIPAAYKIPLAKRIFDIVISLSILIFLFPFFCILGLLIVIESRGPIFYSSKRVGTGYKIFNFYKFRSMGTGADSKLKDIAHLNQYNKKEGSTSPIAENELCDSCKEQRISCQSIVYLDGNAICEKVHFKNKILKNGSTFIKINNDPRVTRVGKFIRNTSIDELPQLFNVLKGDMSIVGNRPLPLYEAEKITTDQFTTRFLAPAGITGLWQVTKRGTGEMSEAERIQLDIDYALTYSFVNDIKIILKTIPALIQKENV